MTLSKNLEKKIGKKIKRCQLLIEKDAGTQFCDDPTEFIVICNAGLSTGLQQEALLAEALQHGPIKQVQFPPGKSFCFLQCTSNTSALAVYTALNGVCALGQDGAVLLLAFCKAFPACQDNDPWCSNNLPSGLILERDFIDETMEKILLEAVNCDDCEETSNEQLNKTLKHRKVKHFGYEFVYGTNNVDKTKPLERKIPAVCNELWSRLQNLHPELRWHVPDQLTVNQYDPGQGIPPHVDTHSAFEDPILSLSLGSEIVMEFKHPSSGKQVCVDLPSRSLLIMGGESRYDWTHGITPRKMDTIRAPNGGLTVRKRKLRVSLTFRKLLQNERCKCQFPRLCNTAREAAEKHTGLLECHAAQVEAQNVHRVYNEIAKHFSDTRHSPWPRVEAFVQSLPAGAVLLDVGCGNGKYLASSERAVMLGCDRSEGLLQVCVERGFNVLQCDCLAVPFRDESVDACISIAVIHHLATDQRRKQAISEMVRVLRPGGKALMYVWAKNQEANAQKSSYLRQNKLNNKPSAQNDLELTRESAPIVQTENVVVGVTDCTLPVHTNRTQFQHQDLLVPWKLRTNESLEKTTFLRYYHVFEEHELEKLCLASGTDQIELVESYYDQGNWCVVLEKKSFTNPTTISS
ncbi:alkylated DNA repair protein alkB homolog 8 [Anopheles maculipalpis]|uniref:alkylated DNA repair protein alkB homolog 8 n=1 Tax=Anopheles maculipalpis TaxID=1496333 RepID=UPI002158ACF0|nr:alkylated DNA repair protein alkB homolog 8 [Anopheles maculipalpis]